MSGRDVGRGMADRDSTRRPPHSAIVRIEALAVATALAVTVPLPAVASGAPLPTRDRSITLDSATPLPASLWFKGRGWGHGVGLSQWGARGRAVAAQTASQILAHYYQGTTIGTVSVSTRVRVLVYRTAQPPSTDPIRLYGRYGSWKIDGIDRTFPAEAQLRAWKTTVTTSTGTKKLAWAVRIVARDGTTIHRFVKAGDTRLRPAASATRLQVASRPGTYDVYRGNLLLHLGSSASVVNEVALDLYLRGVVPMEMPASWPTQALRAQTIAARSYAARALHPGTGLFDLYDDTRSQVYRGVRGEHSATNAAITATAGRVLKSGSAIANALFHSTGGGATENNENVFVSQSGSTIAGAVSYLRGSLDRNADGKAYDAASPHYSWRTSTYTRSALGAILGKDPRTAVGTLKALDLSTRGVSGRLIRVTIVGSAGTRTVSGNVFRSVFNAHRPAGDPSLQSTLFFVVDAT